MTADLESLLAPGRMRTYRGEDRARLTCPGEPLDGTLETAQAYVDRITRSAWWRRTCPPDAYLGSTSRVTVRPPYARNVQPPTRIIVERHGKGGGVAYTGSRVERRGKWYPLIRLGAKHADDMPEGRRYVAGWTSAITDPYVVLHEVAHIMAACDGRERGHGRVFRWYMVLLVRRWMGPDHARALTAGYDAEGVKWRKPRAT